MLQTKPQSHTKQAKLQFCISWSLHFWTVNWKTKDPAPNDGKYSLTSTCSEFLHEWISICYDSSQISELFHSSKGFIALETQICVKKIHLNLPGSHTNKPTSFTKSLTYDSTWNFVEQYNFTTANPLHVTHYLLHSPIQKAQNYITLSSISIQDNSLFNYFQSMDRGTSWSKTLTAFFS
jgi:hypothetical protein